MHTVILGLDAYDPGVFENLSSEGKLPNLTKWADSNGYSPFQVSTPPQSEVSWTSIATGADPGHHGIFDFVQRNPKTYTPYVSMLVMSKGVGGTQFVPPYRTPTLFDEAAHQGYPSTALWWPATFPAKRESPVRTMPGLGTPDIQGRLGVGYFYATSADLITSLNKTPWAILKSCGKDCYSGEFVGPERRTRHGKASAKMSFRIALKSGDYATLSIDKQRIDLRHGEWSPVLELSFKMGAFARVYAITQVIYDIKDGAVTLYAMPMQIHPTRNFWGYGSPASFVKRNWKESGPFLTLGMPQDTTALEDGCITDEQFLDLCDFIFESRRQMLMRHLERFSEGVFASVFDSLDRIQHMFWKSRPDVVQAWYEKYDSLVGEVALSIKAQGKGFTRIVVVSDHGFARFDKKAHLNRWLIDHGYMVARTDATEGSLKDVDWTKTRAYAIGLNSLYLNLEGREGQGIVPPEQAPDLADELIRELGGWHDGDKPVVSKVRQRVEVFSGPLVNSSPDLVVGYADGYRGSSETGMGGWPAETITWNTDHWASDHCIDADLVPGSIFVNQGMGGYSHPSFHDFPMIAIDRNPSGTGKAKPVVVDEEDEQTLDERLKSLGYL